MASVAVTTVRTVTVHLTPVESAALRGLLVRRGATLNATLRSLRDALEQQPEFPDDEAPDTEAQDEAVMRGFQRVQQVYPCPVMRGRLSCQGKLGHRGRHTWKKRGGTSK